MGIASTKIDYARALNEEQLAVVKGSDGPTLVLAGAGSGKTRTVTYRVAWLLEHSVPPDRILLVTFTNKAAREMIERLASLLGAYPQGLWAGTFHSIANKLLRVYAPRVGYTPGFTILDQDDAVSLVKVCIKEEKVDVGAKRFPAPRVLLGVLSYARNRQTVLREVLEKRFVSFVDSQDQIERIAARYEQKKHASNAMDFDDLLCHMLTLLCEHADVEDALAAQFQYVLVDEYQDTNALQAAMVARLSKTHRHVLVVGDDAQSIYSFRAADVRNILEFPSRHADCQTFRLQANYRSTPEILALANASIACNEGQFPKELRAMGVKGERPTLVEALSATDEARAILSAVEAARRRGVAASDIAVLFRATFQSQTLEFELMRRNIAYEYRGGMRFFERAHVKDVLAFLRIAFNPLDTAAWLRVLGLQRGIGPVTAARFVAHIHARAPERVSAEWLEDIGAMVSPRSQDGWRVVETILQSVLSHDALGERVRAVAQSSYVEYLEAIYPNAVDRLDDIHELEQFALTYGTDQARFFEEITLRDEFSAQMDARGERDERIVLSTIHQAKGLEWDTVCVMGLVDGQFPGHRALAEQGGLEEERRLFYVAVTRARRSLLLSYSMTGSGARSALAVPSVFVEEVPKELLKTVRATASAHLSERRADAYTQWDDRRGDHEPVIVLDAQGERTLAPRRSGFLRDVS